MSSRTTRLTLDYRNKKASPDFHMQCAPQTHRHTNSNATVHAGGDMAIKFDTVTTEGNLLTGPFDVHLYNGLNEVR